MNMNETLTLLAIMLAPAFFSLLGLAAFGSPIVATLGEMAAKTKKRVFYDKLGQQVAAMGCILIPLLLLIDCGAAAVAYLKFPQYFQQIVNLSQQFMWALVACGAFTVFSLLYMATWKVMRNSKGAHMALGVLATVASVASIAQIVPAKMLLTLTAETTPTAAQAQPMALAMAVMYTVLTVSAAAGLACAYLVIRRNKDDFGRDYYNFALKLAARWAAIPMIGFLACQGWLFFVLPETFKALTLGTPLGFVWIAAALLGIICTVLWVLIARSQTPLQLKGMTFVAAGLMWLMHACNATLFLNYMSMF